MACPTCDHTMHKICDKTDMKALIHVFWCPRCGTLRQLTPLTSHELDTPPKLPERVRLMLPFLNDTQKQAAWVSGLYESCMINPEYPKVAATT